MRPKILVPALVVCLALLLGCLSWSQAATSQAQIANLKFSGPISQAGQKYLGLKTSGSFSLQDIQAPYVLIELMRTT
jgi:hypothetical protein